jgi:hypothetical protein
MVVPALLQRSLVALQEKRYWPCIFLFAFSIKAYTLLMVE